MAAIVTSADLPADVRSNELVNVMLAGANARAARVAPCLVDTTTPPTSDQLAEAKLVLIGAISRWAQAGSGAVQSQAAGPFSVTVDTRQRATGYNLWPSEIKQLQDICANGKTASSGAFSITPGATDTVHMPWCALLLGATFCSCGADIAGLPIYETGDTY
ncbi:MAG TPA: hypothetical protein VFH80_06050 [Solirubrobacteraceae bacterium]|nr:hypothetical protein [Solirubrobacteraceae bacterium]